MADTSLPLLRPPCTCISMSDECPVCRAWRLQHARPLPTGQRPDYLARLRAQLTHQLAKLDRAYKTAKRQGDREAVTCVQRQRHNVCRRLKRLGTGDTLVTQE